MEEEKVTIHLSESTDASFYPVNQMIYGKEFATICELIDEQIKFEGTQSENKNSFKRKNNAVSVFGSRGCGKTSFLMSIKDKYDKHEEVEVLDVLDPTLIEEKGHVFLSILSLIKDKAKRKLDNLQKDPSWFSECGIKQEWSDKLEKLAMGIPSLDHVGKSLEEDNWQDPQYIMNKGLKDVSASRTLESDFQDFVCFSLNHILKKKVFLLLLDDIDIDFLKGWPVLETLRKYLTFPEIIVVISGDERLFTKAVRKKQWSNFGKALLINEGDRLNKMGELNDLVTEMGGQYLQKILKPQLQASLMSLSEIFQQNKKRVKQIIINSGKVEGIKEEVYNTDIVNVYKISLSKIGIKSSFQQEPYLLFLLSTPFRSQIQFLIGSLKLQSNDWNVHKNGAFVFDVFNNHLQEKQINYRLLQNNIHFFNSSILKFLIRDQILSNSYQLQPNTDDDSLNACLTAFTFAFCKQTKTHPEIVFNYLIKIGYIRNLLSGINYAKPIDNKSNASPYNIEDMCELAGVYTDKTLRDTVGIISSYIYSTQTNPKDTGIFYLQGLSSTGKGSKEENKGKLDFEFEYEFESKRVLAFIPAGMARTERNQVRPVFYSIYMLLSTIGEILRQYQNHISDLGETEQFVAMKETLSELSQINSFISPDFKNNIEGDSGSIDTINIEFKDNPADKSIDKLTEDVIAWCKVTCEETDYVPPHLVGKISMRLFYALSMIKLNNDCLGNAFHRAIIILLNSILVEEVTENIPDRIMLRNNPSETDNVFEENILKLRDGEPKEFNVEHLTKLPFFSMVINCPLIKAFINRNALLKERSNRKLSKEESDKILNIILREPLEYSAYEALCRVTISKAANTTIKKATVSKKRSSSKKAISEKSFSSDESELSNTISILKADGIKWSVFDNITDASKILKEKKYSNINKKSMSSFYDCINKIDSREGISAEVKADIITWKEER